MTEPSVSPHGRAAPFRLILAALAGTAAIAAAVFVGMRDRADLQAVPAAETAQVAPVPADRDRPGFDVVRVNPRGDAVIAGHAPPGAEVRIEDAGREIGRAQADQRGDWVFVPTEPLTAGGRELTLAAKTPDGHETRSAGSVLLVIPERTSPDAALAVLSAPDAPPVVLQSAPGDGQAIGLDAAERDPQGVLRLAGRAPPQALVRVYLDDKPVGDARADAQGRWTLLPAGPVAPGEHSVRLDQLAGNGRVVARALAPLPRQDEPNADEGQVVVVQSGQTLWRLARGAYGSGIRYTVLYQANREQIRDPSRIYPGQTFVVPSLKVR